MNTVSTLDLGTKSNGSPQSDNRWPILLLAGLDDCVVDAGEITMNPSVWGPWRPILNILITVIHMENLPTVG